MNFLISSLIITFCSTSFLQAAELVIVPTGKIEAIWLSPISKKAKVKSSQVIITVNTFKSQVYPVTVMQFREFLATHPEWSKNNASTLFKDDYYLRDLETAP